MGAGKAKGHVTVPMVVNTRDISLPGGVTKSAITTLNACSIAMHRAVLPFTWPSEYRSPSWMMVG